MKFAAAILTIFLAVTAILCIALYEATYPELTIRQIIKDTYWMGFIVSIPSLVVFIHHLVNRNERGGRWDDRD